MSDASEPQPSRPSVGLAVLHLFLRVGPSADRAGVEQAVASAREDGTQVVTIALLGHKGDLGIMALSDDQWALRHLQSRLVGCGLELVGSYVSLTELSEYSQDVPDKMKEARLHPQLPPEGKGAFCFYPMSKKRVEGANWFVLPYDERRELMFEHGASGRSFAGRVVQVITGSTGLDDFEWGVTLFAANPDDLKEVVYTMRFDQASAVYADFGPFFTGMVASTGQVLDSLGAR